jgi:NADH:ubiquinone oxidoreductase subunit F (NADH-binding)/(2Fe-2S) ferredoxin
MTLNSREAFEDYAASARETWEQRFSGDDWVVSVGISECSKAKGALDTFANLQLHLEKSELPFELRKVGCAGWCFAEPFVEVKPPDGPPIIYENVVTENVPDLVDSFRKGVLPTEGAMGVRADEAFNGIPPLDEHPFLRGQRRVLLENSGIIDPESIEDYIARGGYSAFVKALFDMTPEEVVHEVKEANVRGRGGAGFPAGIKWESGRRTQAWPKYVVANSHEGEPNVFKDRRLIESDPHLVLEGIMIGCYALETPHGYNYIGGEHFLALERFQKAVLDAYELGLLGENVLGSGKAFHMRVRSGGGAYICGEGSALMYAIMGERGQPRTKPPRSVEEGVWRRPTVLNNTETYASVPAIINNGGAWYASIGTEQSKGTKLVTIQGPVKRLGVAEVEMGYSLDDLINEIYGGAKEGYTLKGIQTGGVSAGPLRMEQLDVGIDFESLDEVGAMLGSGGFVAFDESVCAVDFARYLTRFNRFESCAKCTPCRLGNVALLEIVDKVRNGYPPDGVEPLIDGTSEKIIDLSLCGLGQVAPMPLLGMIKAFPEEFEQHIKNRECPTGQCPVSERQPVAEPIPAD